MATGAANSGGRPPGLPPLRMGGPPPGLAPLRMGGPPPGLASLRMGGLSSFGNGDSPELINPLKNGLGAGETLEPLHEGAQKVYASNVYKIKNSSGAVRGIRKVVYAHSPGLFEPTRKEQVIYTTLKGTPGHERYILPYKQGSRNAGSVYLNFNWKDGSDLIDYLESRMKSRSASLSTGERRDIIVRAATALKWLAEQGYIHGDIKFQNLYRDISGNIYLLDFGSASSIKSAQEIQIKREIGKFIEMITPIADTVLTFNLTPYESDYSKAIIPFYDAIIRYYSNPTQTGGRRYRRKTRRHAKKRRNTRRRKI